MTKLYKLARPLMRGVVVEILNGKPYVIDNVRKFTGEREVRSPVANNMVNELLGGLPQFKGEIVVGKPIADDCREVTMEFLKVEDAIHPFVFWVYDILTTGVYDLRRRLEIADHFCDTVGPVIQFVDHTLIESSEALAQYKQQVIINDHFPGVVLREPFGTYRTQDEEIKAPAPEEAL